MKTIKLKVFSFSELSEDVQLKIYEDSINSFEYFGHSDNVNTLEKFENIFPIKVKKYEYGYHDFIEFEFTGTDDVENLTGQRLANYLWNNYGHQIYKGKYFSLWSKKEVTFKHHINGYPVLKTRHSKIMLDNCCILTGYCIDDDILKPVYDFMNKPDSDNFYDLMESCLNSWLSACSKDYEWQSSFECFKEEQENNDYQYTKNGQII
ncbi:MAG: hypothetical protein WC389_14995 [Lutibacter sp.]|jgi:hypothetical protein